MSYIPSVVGIIDNNNSTSTLLISNDNFIGEGTDVSLYSTVTVSVISDISSATNGLSVQFSSDNSNWDYIKTYTLSSNIIQNHVFNILGKFFRIVYTNSGTDQTFFRLQTMVNPSKTNNLTTTISDSINYNTTDCITTNSVMNGITHTTNLIDPLTTDNRGNLNVVIQSPTSGFGDFRAIFPEPVSQIDFVYGVNENMTNSILIGTGTVSSVNALAVVSSGTTTESSANLICERYLKYRPGQGGLLRFTALYTSGISGTTQLAGSGTSNDGYFFGWNGDVFGILFRSSSSGSLVDTWIPQTTWNGDVMDGSANVNNKSGMLLDSTNGNVFQITFTYLGFGNIYFFIMSSETGNFILVHTIKYSNSNTNTVVRNPSFPVYYYVTNGATTSDIIVRSASSSQFVDGIKKYLGPIYSLNNTKNTANPLNTYASILTITNSTTFGGITNMAHINLRTLSCGTILSSGSVTTVTLYLNPTLSVAPSFTNVDVNNSIVSYDKTSTSTLTGGRELYTIICGSGSSNIIDLTDLDIYLIPGDVLTFAVKTTTNTTISMSINWSEDI